MQQDDVLKHIRVSLLPEWLLAAPKQVIQQAGDAIRQGVGFQVVVKRVVPELRVERDFNIVAFAAMAGEGVSHLMTEVAFDFENQSTGTPFGISRTKGENLVGEGVHAAGGLPAYGAEDGDASEESTLGNRQP